MANTQRVYGAIPGEAEATLRKLGENLRIARKRRGLTIQQMADRVMVPSPTIRKLEQGDPTVSLGIVAIAMSVIGLGDDLRVLADPARDLEGLFAAAARNRDRVEQVGYGDF